MATFLTLAVLADQLAAEGGRLKKRAAIAAAVGAIAAESLPDAGLFCLYLAGEPFAEADPRKLNAGGAILTKALKAVSGCTDAALTAAYRRHGDLGASAFDVLEGRGADAAGIPLRDVAAAFEAMAAARTTAVRASLVEGLLQQATPVEAKYLLKLMLGDMRIGVKQSLIEEAIAIAAKADVSAVRHAVMLEADLGDTVRMAFTGALLEARMRLFHPLGFMLASPVERPEEAVERFAGKPEKPPKPPKKKRGRKAEVSEEFEDLEAVEALVSDDVASTEADAPPVAKDDSPAGGSGSAAHVQAFLEDKYDGMRAQLHCGDATQPGRVAIYSRNREDITHSFPELCEAFAHVSEPLILDGEILGWDLATEKALPFSILGQRIGRKVVDNALRKQVPVVFMAFDLLFAGGNLLLPLPLRERRSQLEAVVERLQPATEGSLEKPAEQHHLFSAAAAGTTVQRLRLSPARFVEDAAAIDAAYADARARANEGVMLKAADSVYQPGRRGLAWVKLKRELATLDVVITGAEFGSGRRARFLSDYTFAVRGPGNDLLNVGKAYSGVTDAEIVELTEWLQAHTLEDHGHFRTVEPIRVLEVAFNNVMRSERHVSGFALRFPRILKIRDDKPVEEIDTLERVEEIYQSQPDKGGE